MLKETYCHIIRPLPNLLKDAAGAGGVGGGGGGGLAVAADKDHHLVMAGASQRLTGQRTTIIINRLEKKV